MKTFITSLLKGASSPVSETKSAKPPLIALQISGEASWTPRHYSALSREGFQRNPIAYRCIRMVAEAAASVKLCHPTRPGISLFALDIMERFYGYLQMTGNAYLKLGQLDGSPACLFNLRSDKVSIQTNKQGRVVAFVYEAGSVRQSFPIDLISGQSDVFHVKLFNPDSDLYGYSPLEAAAQSIDIHNEGSLWTKALLDNSARPSGALVYNGAGGDHLTSDQFDRLKVELESAYAGAKHAGRPMVLEGGLDWKSMSMSPSDMDFLEARREAAREIALAFGVPPMLLGIKGDNTYANYHEANQAFWRQTIIPLVKKTAEGLQDWLSPYYDDTFTVTPDLDRVPALSEERAALWNRLESASFLSEPEKRALAGLVINHG